jgi:hypothetical protein
LDSEDEDCGKAGKRSALLGQLVLGASEGSSNTNHACGSYRGRGLEIDKAVWNMHKLS